MGGRNHKKRRGGYLPPENYVAIATLRQPIMVLGEEVDELYFRGVELGDFDDDFSLEDIETELLKPATIREFTRVLTNISPKAAKTISFADLEVLGEAVAKAFDPFGDSDESSEGAES